MYPIYQIVILNIRIADNFIKNYSMQAENNTQFTEILTHECLLQSQQALNLIPNRKYMSQEQISQCFDLTVELCRIKQVVELVVDLEEIRRTLLSKSSKQNMNINSDELLHARLTIQHLLSIQQAKELMISKERNIPNQWILSLKLLNLPNIRSIIQWNSNNIHRQLCSAVKQLNVQNARQLISLGADVNFQLNMNNSFQTYSTRSYMWKSASPLFLALRNSFRKDQQQAFVDMIELLLQNGADWKQFNTIIYQCMENSYGKWESDNVFSALPETLDMFGDVQQRERFLQILASYQVDLNYLQQKQIESTYESSSENKSLMMDLLNKYFAKKTATIYKRERSELLDNKFRDLLEQVLRYGVDVDSYKSKCSVDKARGFATWEYESALHLCIKNQQTFLISYLLDKGASIDRDYIYLEVGQTDGRISPNSKIVRTVELAKQYKIDEQIIKRMQRKQYLNTLSSYNVFDIVSLAIKDNVHEKLINFLRWKQLGKNQTTDMTD